MQYTIAIFCNYKFELYMYILKTNGILFFDFFLIIHVHIIFLYPVKTFCEYMYNMLSILLIS